MPGYVERVGLLDDWVGGKAGVHRNGERTKEEEREELVLSPSHW